MAILPRAQAMAFCDQVIAEAKTQKVSLIGTFWGMGIEDPFPVRPAPFSVIVPLTNGFGPIPLHLTISREDGIDLVEMYSHQTVLTFPDRFFTTYYSVRFRTIVWPEPGYYHFVLTSGEMELARAALRVYTAGANS